MFIATDRRGPKTPAGRHVAPTWRSLRSYYKHAARLFSVAQTSSLLYRSASSLQTVSRFWARPAHWRLHLIRFAKSLAHLGDEPFSAATTQNGMAQPDKLFGERPAKASRRSAADTKAIPAP